MKIPFLTFLFSSLAVVGFAEVEPWVVATGKAGNFINAPATYTVPAGKVFIIESVQYQSESASGPLGGTVSIQVRRNVQNISSPATIVTNIKLGEHEPNKSFDLAKPIRLSAGESLDSSILLFLGYTIYSGLLVDKGDLFADLDVELKDSSVGEGKLKALAKVTPTRPYRLSIESTTNLSNFSAEPEAVITSTDLASEKEIAVDADAGRTFVRASAVARPKHMQTP